MCEQMQMPVSRSPVMEGYKVAPTLLRGMVFAAQAQWRFYILQQIVRT